MRTAPRLSLGALACVLGLSLANISLEASALGASGANGSTKTNSVSPKKPATHTDAASVQKKRVKKALPKKTQHGLVKGATTGSQAGAQTGTRTGAVRKTSRLTLAAQAAVGVISEARAPFINEALLPPVGNGQCPSDMVSIDQRYCVDKYEASLVEMTTGGERPFSPYDVVDGHDVRAVSAANVFPQGYISGVQARDACSRAGKRLCKAVEWRKACVGPESHAYGYSDTRQRGVCNDSGRSPMLEIWHLGGEAAANMWDPLRMNDSRLNQLPGSLAQTGAHPDCTNGYGVFDMVGNLHEWVDDSAGTFQGGYYLDTTINGEGCGYRTSAHDLSYHDYSTGFRCCADLEE